MWPAVAIGPVKCGTMPTRCVSHTAMIFSISVMPPTFGSDTRAKSMSRCSTSGLKSRGSPLLARRQRHRRHQPQLRQLRPELLLAQRVLDDERAMRFQEAAHFDGLVEVELLMQVDHPVAVGPTPSRICAAASAISRMCDRESKVAPCAVRGVRRRGRPDSAGCRCPPEHAIARRHRPCRPLLEVMAAGFRAGTSPCGRPEVAYSSMCSRALPPNIW
jgi:hypothetical protein